MPLNVALYLATLDEPVGSRLLADNSGAIYAPPPPGARYGHLLFLRDFETLLAQPFDEGTLANWLATPS